MDRRRRWWWTCGIVFVIGLISLVVFLLALDSDQLDTMDQLVSAISGYLTLAAFVVAAFTLAGAIQQPARPATKAAASADSAESLAADPASAPAGIGGPGEAGSPPRTDPELAAARRSHLARLRERYGRVDLEILLPLTEQDEYPPVKLREVFIPQAVRADPPPVELPRELWQRLAEAGEIDPGELPEGVDPETIDKLRQAYHDSPARSVLQVLSEPARRRLVLLGDPGSGKSSIARYLALALADDNPPGPLARLAGWLPLLVELRTHADPRLWDQRFLDLIEHLHDTEGVGLPQALLERYLRTDGRAVVIFDGLDEVFDPQQRETVAHRITGFAAQYPKVRIVVTSRVIGYRRQILAAAGFAHHTLQDLDQQQIDRFVTGWYGIACTDRPAEAPRLRARLLRAIGDNPAVRELAGNPMLLTILSIIGRRRELPRDRRTVYEHAISVLVEHWEVNKHLDEAGLAGELPPLDHADKLELLRLVARRMQDTAAGLAGNHIPGPDLLNEFDAYLRSRYELPAYRAIPAARAMLGQFRERNFILSRFGAEVYGFVHRAFLEYLAAADIVHRFTDERSLTEAELITEVYGQRWRDPAWHEVLLLVTGMINERFAGHAIDHLLAADPLWFLRPGELPSHTLLAIRCVGEARKLGPLSAQSMTITNTVIDLLETAHEREAYKLEQPLTGAIEQAVLPVFATVGPHWIGRRRFQDWYLLRGQFLSAIAFGPEPVVSLATRLAATLLAEPQFRDLLRAQATLAADAGLRRAAVRALAGGWRQDPHTLPLLRERVTTDPSQAVRRAAVQVLVAGWRNDPQVAALLRGRATTDPSWNVRQAAVQAVATGWRHHPDTASWLRKRATTDHSWNVREAAIHALATGGHDDPQTAELLREAATGDRHEAVRKAALEALAAGWRNHPRVAALLRDRATTDQSWQVRKAALPALATGWHDHPQTAELLHEAATGDRHEAVRKAALEALAAGWRDDPRVATRLRERAADDHDWQVRQAAARVLATGWPDHPDTAALLHQRATDDPSWNVRQAAVEALATGWHDHPPTVDLLRERATSDPDGDVRHAAVQALAAGWHDHPDTLPWLRARATSDSDSDVRHAAVQAVATGWPDDPDTAALLRGCASGDESWSVRQAAVQAMAAGWHDHPDTPALLRQRATDDPSWSVRYAAVQALAAGWRDHPQTLPWLRQRATIDPSGDVRYAAVQALVAGWRDDPQTLPWLRERATTDPDADVRNVAVQVVAAGWRDDPQTLPWLRERATTDPSWTVRQAAVPALAAGWRDDPQTLSWLRERADSDPHEAVRRAAVQALAAGWPDDPPVPEQPADPTPPQL